ncbi:MAG: radical SAM protein [Planctomycetota bacterium]
MINLSRTARLFYGIWRDHLPKQLVIQLTDRCNARCPQCGMRVTERFSRSSLTVERVKQLIDQSAHHGVEAVSLTGGEPLLEQNRLVELIRHAGQAGIRYIRTGTNGFSFRGPDEPDFTDRVTALAESLASTPLRNFWISIDSAEPEIHERMRGFPGVVRGIERALPIFHRLGLYPSANLGVNRNVGGAGTASLRLPADGGTSTEREAFYEGYRSAFRRFYRLIIDMGFSLVNACYPMSVEDNTVGLSAVYRATSEEDIVHYNAAEKVMLFRALGDTIPEFRAEVRVFSPRSSLRALVRQYEHAVQPHGPGGQALPADDQPYPCRGGLDFYFVDSKDGAVYPCGYRGSEKLHEPWKRNGKAPCATDCYRCDWECFRDPSELFGPLLEAFASPRKLIARWRRDPEYFRLWRDDLRYQLACDLFDGRKPLSPEKLRRFARPAA